jgi:hypothetical protein
MKKSNILKFSFLFVVLLLKLLLIHPTVIADEASTAPNLGPLAGIEMDPSTGLPEGFGKFQEIADNLSTEEKKEQYIKQEWAKLFANNKYLGPPLYYTTNFFSYFNPLWKLIFGIEFSWSWLFIFCITLWIMLASIIYFPLKEIMNTNQILSIIASIAIASLVGISGVIPRAAGTLTFAVKNIWIAIVSLAIAFFIVMLYSQLMKNFKKESEEEEFQRARETIKTEGKIAEKSLESYK